MKKQAAPVPQPDRQLQFLALCTVMAALLLGSVVLFQRHREAKMLEAFAAEHPRNRPVVDKGATSPPHTVRRVGVK